MKISPAKKFLGTAAPAARHPAAATRRTQRAFTLMEIAICLGIIGFALVALISIFPGGSRSQRDSREETIVNQDASVIFEAVRNGSRGADDLTNYVYAIINNNSNNPVGYTNQLAGRIGFSIAKFPFIPPGNWRFALTNGANIIGLLSTPEFVDGNYDPTNNLLSPNTYSNRVTAYVTAISGLVAEKPPQDNDILRQDTFGYRIYCVNAAVPVDTNTLALPANNPARLYADNLSRNQHELRMTFDWPVLPNGNIGNGRQTFRATIAGQLVHVITNGFDLYFYHSQFFTNAP
jgi:type II secretory pathway pseudopilin PulG